MKRLFIFILCLIILGVSDGKAKQFSLKSRPEITGLEETRLKPGLGQKGEGPGKVVRLGDTLSGHSLPDAIKAIGSSRVTSLHVPPGTNIIGSNLTIPQNISLKLERGAILHCNPGVTLTINGTLEAGPYQIFAWSGTGKVVFGHGSVKELLIRWWGAKGDGTTDDTAAVQAALNTLASGAFSASLYGCAGDVYLVDTVRFTNTGSGYGGVQRICGNGAKFKQKGTNDLLKADGDINTKWIIEQFGFIGSVSWAWYQDGIRREPTAVTFNGTAGKKKKAYVELQTEKDWYYDSHAHRLYIRVMTSAVNVPETKYANPGVQIDGGPAVTHWKRSFMGDGLEMASLMGTVRDCVFTYFDRAIWVHGNPGGEIRDCAITWVNNAVYGDRAPKTANHSFVIRNVKIAFSYEDAFVWKDAYGLNLQSVYIEFFYKRAFNFFHGNNITLEHTNFEVASWGKSVREVFLFDGCNDVIMRNGSWIVGAEDAGHALTRVCRFINGCGGITIHNTRFAFKDHSKYKLYLYSSDGTLKNFAVRDNTSGSFRLTEDAAPVAWCTNNSVGGAALINMPTNYLQLREAKNLIDYSTVDPSFKNNNLKPACTNCSFSYDNNTGFDDHFSGKITWTGVGAQNLEFLKYFSNPPAGLYYGVMSFKYKADAAQKIKVVWGNYWGGPDNLVVSGDGIWRAAFYLAGQAKDMSGPKPHALQIFSNGDNNTHLWIDDVSVHWFPTQAEAAAWVGAQPNPSK